MSPILVERDDARVEITLNRPEARNALDLEMVDALHAALGKLEVDRSVGVLIFLGAGEKAFVAGADIAQLKDRDALDSLAGINARLFERIERFPQPTIAAVQGYALGGGCEFALACDLRVAGETARFGQPEVGLGIMPAAGGTQRLPKLIGLSRAKEWVLTGRLIEAEEAERVGLVHRLVSDDKVLEEARQLARELLRQGPLALRMAKLALNASFSGEVGFTLESVGQALLFDSTDKHERMEKFLSRQSARGTKKTPVDDTAATDGEGS